MFFFYKEGKPYFYCVPLKHLCTYRTGKIGTDQELLNSVMQSSGELSNAAETEDERCVM